MQINTTFEKANFWTTSNYCEISIVKENNFKNKNLKRFFSLFDPPIILPNQRGDGKCL